MLLLLVSTESQYGEMKNVVHAKVNRSVWGKVRYQSYSPSRGRGFKA